MGKIMEYECKDCKNKFTAKIGLGSRVKTPRPKPTKCPKCSSNKIKELGEVGNWD